MFTKKKNLLHTEKQVRTQQHKQIQEKFTKNLNAAFSFSNKKVFFLFQR